MKIKKGMEAKHGLHIERLAHYGEYKSNSHQLFSFSILKIGHVWCTRRLFVYYF